MRGLSILQYFLGVLFFVELVTLIFVVTSFGPGENESPGSERNKTAPIVEPLEVFQVQQPLRKSYEGSSCQQVVLQHDFAASYGSPYAGKCPHILESFLNPDAFKERTRPLKIVILLQQSSIFPSHRQASITTVLASSSLETSKYGEFQQRCQSELVSTPIFRKT
jgi:hypothetical protein